MSWKGTPHRKGGVRTVRLNQPHRGKENDGREEENGAGHRVHQLVAHDGLTTEAVARFPANSRNPRFLKR